MLTVLSHFGVSSHCFSLVLFYFFAANFKPPSSYIIGGFGSPVQLLNFFMFSAADF